MFKYVKTIWLCVILAPIAAFSQGAAKTVSLSAKSNASPKEISKLLHKRCPDINLVPGAAGAAYALEAVEKVERSGLGIVHERLFDLTLLDRDGILVRGASAYSLGAAIRDICESLEKSIPFEVVDAKTLTLSSDMRGDTSNGLIGALVTSSNGRRTHTDSTTVSVIVNGEHALLDCYEHRTGCATIAPGKYYGKLEGDGIWIDSKMPLTHEPMRNHYKLAGSW
jgi:hypothetical protein